ncbi:MAG: chorismate synthase [Planctomycetes bacterium]|nr:chorismate synthase [Planctomycetota bacterium]
MSNTFGEFFRITTWGESHGPGIGVVIDGIPPGLALDLARIDAELARRRPGGALASPRRESDAFEIQSGVLDGRTLGTPLALWIPNRDARPADYAPLASLYRPGHADFTYEARYGIRDPRGGGRASARETAARVAAGAIARQLLETEAPVEIVAWVAALAGDEAAVNPQAVTRAAVDASAVRCPDQAAGARFEARIAEARDAGDSIGGTIALVARGVPAGWGDPLFGKVTARLAHGCLSLPAAVAFEMGDGFAATRRTGSEQNDALISDAHGGIVPATNRAGGVQGGITNGAPLFFRVGFKAPSTIRKPQATVGRGGERVEFSGSGRHDPCVLPRAVPIVEAMAALVLVDCLVSRRAAPPARKG